MDLIVQYVVTELSVIKQAPIPFALCLMVISLIIWRAMAWRYGAVIDSLESRNKLQADQISDYKDKLKGASPDEAKARLDALEATVKKLSPRSLSSEQSDTLVGQLSKDPGRANITLAMASNNGKILHADLEKCFREAGYQIKTWVSGQTKITHNGLSFGVPNIDQLSPRQELVLNALRGLNLDVAVVHQPDHPANEFPNDIWLTVQ